jgi:prenyltransferase beta subunit
MLQVARLAPRQLGESRDLVAAFLHSALTVDGGFRDRAGAADLYYTVFGLEGLIALQEPLPTPAVASYLARFGDGGGLDFIHLTCLIRAWAAIDPGMAGAPGAALLGRLAQYRSTDGAFAQTPQAHAGSVYASYLALGAYQDLHAALPDSDGLVNLVAASRALDGGYGNHPGDRHGLTTTTAAAVILLRELDAPVDSHLGMWLLDRCHGSGGFFPSPAAPLPDLLSTATALHALAGLRVPIDGLQESCLDFVDSLWSGRGGFVGSWADDVIDCEYTYYGLLALGHLSLAPPR